MRIKRLILVLLAAFILGIGTAEPSFAWWRGGWGGAGGWHGGGGGWHGGGWQGGGWYGLAAGLALGGLAGLAAGAAAASASTYSYPAYGCVQRPIYDAWGRFIGYSC